MTEITAMKIRIIAETPGRNQIVYSHDGDGIETIEDLYRVLEEIRKVIA